MPGLNCEKLTFLDESSSSFEGAADIYNLFGFFYCKIEAPVDAYLGLLPVRLNLGII